jgi:hypothetical protein
LREELLKDDIDLALIATLDSVLPRSCIDSRQGFILFPSPRHDEQLPAIEALIAELDDLRMTAVMLP